MISFLESGLALWDEPMFLASTTSEVKKNHAMLSLQILNLSLNSMLANIAVQCELVIFLSSKGEFYDEGFNLINYSNLHWNHMTETSCGCGSCQCHTIQVVFSKVIVHTVKEFHSVFVRVSKAFKITA